MSAFIDEHHRLGVEPSCRIPGVSAFASDQRASGQRSKRVPQDERLLALIGEVHAANDHAYGYRRAWKALPRAGELEARTLGRYVPHELPLMTRGNQHTRSPSTSARLKVVLSDEERVELERVTRRRSSAQGLALRARIVLLAAEGLKSTEIADRLEISRPPVTKWRRRFVEHRLDGLSDEPRPGRPRTIDDEKVEDVIARTLESTPKDATHWSTRSMAAETGLSREAIGRIWRAFGLQPHRVESWKLSKDPFFVEKVRDVVGLSLNPPERAVVLCVDEKSQIRALDRTAPVLPMLPGTPQRATHEDKRHGTSSLYAALDITTGQLIGKLHGRHRAIEFKTFLQTIDQAVPAELDVHVVLENSSPQKTPAIKKWLLAHPRFVLHFTPTSSSWLNLVERWFGELTTKKLQRSAHRSTRALNADIRAWIDTWNENPRPYVWTKTAEDILQSIARYRERITVSRH